MQGNSSYLFLLLILFVTGCDPTRFTLINERNVDCRIYSDHRLVRKSGNGFILDPGGCVSVTYLWATQYRATFRVLLENGEGMTMLLHPVVEERILDSGIVVSVTRKGYEVRDGNMVLAQNEKPMLQEGKAQIFRAYSDEGYLELTLGCDTLYKGINLRTESDDIVFLTDGGSTAHVFGPYWQDTEIVTEEYSRDEK